MPIYLSECRSCERTFETEQRIVEPPLTDCILCEAPNSVKRLIQPTVVLFKGSGFHVNDYSDAKPAAEGSEESAKSSSAAAATTEAASCSGEPAACPACSPVDSSS